jgi:hypothetical protein
MNVKPVPSVDSMQGRYARSSRADPDSASDEVLATLAASTSPAVDSQGKPMIVSGCSNGGSSDDSGPAKFSDAGSQDIPPSICSSDGGAIQQPTEGAPVLGIFDIKVYAVTFAAGTTFSQLLHTLTSF